MEERFPEAFAGGTKDEAFQTFQDAAAIFTGDDAHEWTVQEFKVKQFKKTEGRIGSSTFSLDCVSKSYPIEARAQPRAQNLTPSF